MSRWRSTSVSALGKKVYFKVVRWRVQVRVVNIASQTFPAFTDSWNLIVSPVSETVVCNLPLWWQSCSLPWSLSFLLLDLWGLLLAMVHVYDRYVLTMNWSAISIRKQMLLFLLVLFILKLVCSEINIVISCLHVPFHGVYFLPLCFILSVVYT
jgi:hypothetical protein